MNSFRRHIFCLLFLLLAYPCTSHRSTADEDIAPSIACLDPVYPLALRDRTRMMEEIAAAPTLLNVAEHGEAHAPPLWADLEADVSSESPTGLRLIYVHMSLQI
jgi:hypothetical protein